nr:MAG TPA: hypothetical protein [Caudoviricetes sp.]
MSQPFPPALVIAEQKLELSVDSRECFIRFFVSRRFAGKTRFG